MFNIGQRVKIDGKQDLIGYIVGIEINPLEEWDVNWEAEFYITYIVRRYGSFVKEGYLDFKLTENDIEKV